MEKIAEIIKKMLNTANVSQELAAKCLNKPIGTFRNKLSSDRFSVDELIVLAELCKYRLAFVPNNTELPPEYLSAESYVSDNSLSLLKECQDEQLQKFKQALESLTAGMTDSEKADFLQEQIIKNLK